MNLGYENLPGSSMGGPNFINPIDCYNKLMLKNIQDMLNANPSYLTSGIPNKLLSQMWAAEQNKVNYIFYYPSVHILILL